MKTGTLIRLFPFLIIILWISIQAYFWLASGIRTSVDSEIYLNDAALLQSGKWVQAGRSTWYVGYSAFLAFTLSVGSLTLVVILQTIFSALALYCIFIATRKITSSHTAGLFAAVLYAVWFTLHEWNGFIYTESLFTSFCIISFTVLINSRSRWHYFFAMVLFAFTFFIRPTGIALLFSLMAISLLKISLPRAFKVAMALTGFFVLVILAGIMLSSHSIVSSYVKAELIYPDISLGLSPPGNLVVPDHENPIVNIILFGINNPLYFSKLCLFKAALFFGNIKPYYSVIHNMLIGLTLYPLYLFAFIGGRKLLRDCKIPEALWFILTFIISQGLIVMLTSENWDGRFLIPVLPFIFILSGTGIDFALRKYNCTI